MLLRSGGHHWANLFIRPLDTRLASNRCLFTAEGLDVTACMDDPQIILLEFTSDTVAAISHLWEQLRDIEATVNAAKPLTLPTRGGHFLTAAELTVFAGVEVTVVAATRVSAYGMFYKLRESRSKGSYAKAEQDAVLGCLPGCPTSRLCGLSQLRARHPQSGIRSARDQCPAVEHGM